MNEEQLTVEYEKMLDMCAKTSLMLHELLYSGLPKNLVLKVIEHVAKSLADLSVLLDYTETFRTNPVKPIRNDVEIYDAVDKILGIDFETDLFYIEAQEGLYLLSVTLMNSRPSHSKNVLHMYTALKINTAIINFMNSIERLANLWKKEKNHDRQKHP